MFNPNSLPRNNRRGNNDNNRRPGNIFERARDFFLDQNPVALLFLGLSLVTLVIQSMPYILAGAYTVLATLSLLLWTSLDYAFGARLVSEVPALMWTLWGAVLGACAAFWLSAPLYGWRNKRSFIILLPVLLMVVVGSIISLKVPLPAQPDLLETATAAQTPNTPAP